MESIMNSFNFQRLVSRYFLVVIYILLSLGYVNAQSQPMVFYAEAHREVVGIQDIITISYHLENFPQEAGAPQVDLEGFKLLRPPMNSVSNHIENINGRTSRKFIRSYVFELQAESVGNKHIPPAVVEVGGKKYQSNALNIEVREGTMQQPRRQGRQQQRMRDPFEEMEEWMRQMDEEFRRGRPQRPIQPQADYREFTEDKLNQNIFLRIETDKQSAYEGEPVFVSYKLYARLPMQMTISKSPDLEGFWTEDFDLPQQAIPETQIVNGKEYQVYTLKKSVLYPQLKGNLTLDPVEAKGKVGVAVLKADQWGRNYIDQKEIDAHLKSKPVKIDVKALPSLPEGLSSFQGAVGKIEREVHIGKDKNNIKEPVIITIKYKGVGNLALISAPKIEVPSNLFYGIPEVQKDFRLTPQGLQGEVVFEYVIFAEESGVFEIKVPEDVSFDYEKQSYKRLKNEVFEVQFEGEVATDDAGVESKEVMFFTDNHERQPFRKVPAFWFFASGLLLLASWILVGKNRTRLPFYGLAKTQSKKNKAQKEAWKRLKLASKYAEEHKETLFYEAVLKALILFMSEKLNIPLAHLNKDTYKQALMEKEIPYEHWEKIEKVIYQSEKSLYSGAASNDQSLNDTLEEAQKAMVLLQSFLKDKKS